MVQKFMLYKKQTNLTFAVKKTTILRKFRCFIEDTISNATKDENTWLFKPYMYKNNKIYKKTITLTFWNFFL